MSRTNAVVANSECDFDAALTRLGGDRQLLADMLTIYCEDGPQLLAELQSAVRAADAAAARRLAHALKGLLAGCGGDFASAAAGRLEHAAAAGDSAGLNSLADALAAACERFQRAAAALAM
jgi:HPt (histidine-containing phosphotransfer) domain-containing protein